jgi:epoxyqueuosine reductase
MHTPEERSELVKRFAREAGFDRVAITSADRIADSHARRLMSWLKRGGSAGMDYLDRSRELRIDPRKLVPTARSVICLAVGYAPPAEPRPVESPARIARYARGRDYHRVIKQRCHQVMDHLRGVEPDFDGRAFVDSAPLMERSLAARAGLGWIGRNGCLIVPAMGSYVLLGEVVCNLQLAADRPLETQCESCGLCVDACPTGALGEDGLVDAGKCLSYLNKDAEEFLGAYWPDSSGWVFGCDLCQEACPHNESPPAGDPELTEHMPPLGDLQLAELLGWSRDRWDRATRGSSARESGYDRLMTAAAVAAGCSGDRSLIPLLERLGDHLQPARSACLWAIRRLDNAESSTTE